MNYEEVKHYALTKPETSLDFPFQRDIPLFKVYTKMFALVSWHNEVAWLNLKCDPDQALALRDIFKSVIPAYHMNKTHWNTVILDGSVPRGEIERMIDHSYAMVVRGMTRKMRTNLEIRYGEPAIYCGQ
ncbi:MmcQ/YjbR family DNA-binding protein [Sessilibacter sp. MAH1]